MTVNVKAATQQHKRRAATGWWFNGLALVIYLSSRLIGLTQFPIYFFTDEALQTVRAEQLWQHKLKSNEGEWLPTYFQNGTMYNLSLSVYAQLIPYLLLGKSIVVTRVVSVFISLLLPISIACMLKIIYRKRWWWVGVLLVAVIPAWFLHSRTAFEAVEFVALYAAMLGAYLTYRSGKLKWLVVSVVLAAMAFYSYSPGQVIVAATVVVFGLVDSRFHWQHKRWLLIGLVVGVVLCLPYLRFYLGHTTQVRDHLRVLSSYWVEPMPTAEKWQRFGEAYLTGLSPLFWFSPHWGELMRHVMKGYGNISWFYLPFLLVGLGITGMQIKRAEYRAILLLLLVTPLGGAMVAAGITRNLATLVPIVLLVGLGVDAGLTFIEQRWKWLRRQRLWLAVGVILLLGGWQGYMLHDALVHGPTWFEDYGLQGMQYGAGQLFPAVRHYGQTHPNEKVVVSPVWANGTDVLAAYFLPKDSGVSLASINSYLFAQQPELTKTLLVLTPDEFKQAQESNKLTKIRVEKTILYPNGKPGFYFVRMDYTAGVEALFAAEKEARRQLASETVSMDGEKVVMQHSQLDIGAGGNLVDGDQSTVTRTLEANPYVIQLTFEQSRTLRGYRVTIGSSHIQTTVFLSPSNESEPTVLISEYQGSIHEPVMEVRWHETYEVREVRFEVTDTGQGEPGHVHIWEITLL